MTAKRGSAVAQLAEGWTGDLRVASSRHKADEVTVMTVMTLYPLFNSGST